MSGCILLFFGVLGAIFVGMVAWGLQVSTETRRKTREAAVDSRVQSALRFRIGPVVPREIHGCRIDVRVERDRESGLRYTRVCVDLRGKSPGTLKIAPPGWASRVARMFGDQDIVIGDRAFDNHFIIMANPVSLAQRLFSVERRARLISAVRRIGRGWAPFIDLTKEALNVGVVAAVQSDPQLLDLVATARDFVEALLEIGANSGVVWVEEARAAGGQCQVCGTEMADRVVQCAACGTPHHEECWLYAGECSTYACQETAYLKDGRRVGVGPRARILRIESVDEGLRAPLRSFPQADESLARFERRQRERGR